MPEHVNIDENIRQQAVSYTHIPEEKYSDIKRVVINRNETQNTIGGAK
jgi:hypothetical protein|tara:strand:- start:1234 stop:1377 length:144 start_codon:yes stop_codon:yes gene_type:complete